MRNVLHNMTIQTENAPKKSTTFLWVMFIIYFIVLAQIILVKNPHHFMDSLKWTWRHGLDHSYERANYKFFYTIKRFYNSGSNENSWANVGGNILLFIPFGILVPMLLKQKFKLFKTVVLAFALSFAFELFQLFTGCGFFDVDDILLNTFGGIIGVIVYAIGKLFIIPQIHKERNVLV